jgi:hypothetical protein
VRWPGSFSDAAGGPWTEIFVGGGVAAVAAAVMAGLGVAALAPRMLPFGAVDVGAQGRASRSTAPASSAAFKGQGRPAAQCACRAFGCLQERGARLISQRSQQGVHSQSRLRFQPNLARTVALPRRPAPLKKAIISQGINMEATTRIELVYTVLQTVA